jgi:hypothetical protein
MSQFERFAAMFAALDPDGHRWVMVTLEHEYERVQKSRRPVLRLIQGGPPVESTTKPRVSVRTKKKESA